MWKQKIAACFGSNDLKFAKHPNDIDRALDLLSEIIKNNVEWDELEAATLSVLNEKVKNFSDEKICFDWKQAKIDISAQIIEMRKRFLPWIELDGNE